MFSVSWVLCDKLLLLRRPPWVWGAVRASPVGHAHTYVQRVRTPPPALPCPTECCPILSQPSTLPYTIDRPPSTHRQYCLLCAVLWGTLLSVTWEYCEATLSDFRSQPCGFLTVWQPFSLQPRCVVHWLPFHGPISKGVSYLVVWGRGCWGVLRSGVPGLWASENSPG